jgi:hypothetical protein
MKTMLRRAADVPQYPLQKRQVRCPWIVHMETHLLYGEGDVGARHGEVLECSSQASVRVSIIHSSTISSKFSLGVDRRGDRFAVRHASTLEDVVSILMLAEVESVGGMLNINAEEEVQRAHVADGELGPELIDDGTEKSGARAREYDVIDIEQKVGNITITMIHEEREIRLGGTETDFDHELYKPSVPCARGLSKAIEGLV